MSNIVFRRDISGIRALAVLLVIAYHLGFPISGGFIGVDIFFVLSGFLITGIISRGIIENNFTFKAFYLIRIRRILPVLLVVVLVTLIIGWFIILPYSDFRRFVQSGGLSVISLSNFYLNNITEGYWDAKSDTLPFLHTWSLSVEEQFYLLWPALMLLLFKCCKKNYKLVLLFSALLLLALSEYLAINSPNSAYYLLPARSFELLSGATLSLFMLDNKNGIKLNKNVNHVLSVIGLSGILYSAFYLTKGDLFPGINAMLVCLSTILLLLSGKHIISQGIVNRLFSVDIFVCIGLISYSLYLWHWPIIAFLNYLSIDKTIEVQIYVLIITFLLSALSYRYVENVFRYTFKYRFQKTLIIFLGLPVLCLTPFIVGAKNTDGYKERFNDKDDSIKILISKTYKDCGTKYCGDIANKFKGSIEDSDFLLVGDSHAESIEGFVNVLANNAHKNGSRISYGGTPFLINVDRFDMKKGKLTESFTIKNKSTMNSIRNFKGNTIIIAGRYTEYLKDDIYDPFSRDKGSATQDQSKINFELSFTDTIEEILRLDKKVIIVRDVPDFPLDTSKCPIVDSVFNGIIRCTSEINKIDLPKSNIIINEYFDGISKIYPGVNFLNPSELLCDENKCSAIFNGYTLYRDTSHLSYVGSKILGTEYINRFRNPLMD